MEGATTGAGGGGSGLLRFLKGRLLQALRDAAMMSSDADFIWREARAWKQGPIMWLILLEALGALAILVFLVWWTMFSGRKGGEPAVPVRQDDDEGRSP
jgi:hypothetical protein